MNLKKLVSYLILVTMIAGLLTGCGTKKVASEPSASETTKDSSNVESTTDTTEATVVEDVTLNYWTWFPNEAQAAEAITKFEEANPGIKIKMTVMDSKTYQEKAPLALSTGEDIDVMGVQPSAFAEQVQDYLADLGPLMETAAGADWKSQYSTKALEQGDKLTGGVTKSLVIVNSGSCIGYYNADLLKDIGCEVPKTIEEYKVVADKLKAIYPDKLAGVFAGKEAWVCDEMMLTVLGQKGDTYNQWRYNDASLDSPEFVAAFNGLKKFFDEGIFTKDIMDLDYASAQQVFTDGNALVFYMGSWVSPMLSPKLRAASSITAVNNVGAMALPVVEAGGKGAVRGFLDASIGIVNYSEKQEAAAKFVAFLTVGDGANILSNQLIGPSGKVDCVTDASLFGSEEEKAGWATVNDLISNSTADRNNVSGYSDVEGSIVQSVINDSMTAEEAAATCQKEWTSGKY